MSSESTVCSYRSCSMKACDKHLQACDRAVACSLASKLRTAHVTRERHLQLQEKVLLQTQSREYENLFANKLEEERIQAVHAEEEKQQNRRLDNFKAREQLEVCSRLAAWPLSGLWELQELAASAGHGACASSLQLALEPSRLDVVPTCLLHRKHTDHVGCHDHSTCSLFFTRCRPLIAAASCWGHIGRVPKQIEHLPLNLH